MSQLPALHPQRPALLYGCTILCSLLLSLAAVLGDDVINRDAISYLMAADAYRESGLPGLLAYYNWPLFPVLIALTGSALGIGSLAAAYLLQALLSALVCVAFVALVARLFRNTALTWLAAFTILFYPELNNIRPDIIREQGYLASLLGAVYCTLRYVSAPALQWAAGLAFSIALATLFRIEGVVMALCLPLLTLLDRDQPWRRRWSRAAVLYGLAAAPFGIGAAVWLMLGFNEPWAAGKLQEASGFVGDLGGPFLERLSQRAGQMETEVFEGPYDNWGLVALLGGSMAIVLYRFVTGIGIVALGLALYGLPRCPVPQRRIVLFLVGVSLLAPMLFALDRGFVTSRYLLPASFAVLLLAPLGAARLLEGFRNARGGASRALAAALIGTLALALVIDSLREFRTDKRHLKAAGEWLEANVRPGDAILTDSSRVAYYSRRVARPREVGAVSPPIDWQQVHYVALAVRGQDDVADALLRDPSVRLAAEFPGRGGQRVLILQPAPDSLSGSPPPRSE
jgi:4-amino-4-deoxy-L-arabinose transferase-like glycosyltransferase